MYWGTAFRIWLLSQANNYFSIDTPLYLELIRNLEPSKMVRFIEECIYDIDEYIYEKDFQPMPCSILAAQQYGAYTSMLDITDDIDIALFFTQSYLNSENRKYELCEPNSDNVIYIYWLLQKEQIQ